MVDTLQCIGLILIFAWVVVMDLNISAIQKRLARKERELLS